MILSNSEIVRGIKEGLFNIGNLPGVLDPTKSPFNTSAVDLRLNSELNIPKDDVPLAINLLENRGIANLLRSNSEKTTITKDSPYTLRKGKFILAQTIEIVNFPINDHSISYSARVEGKSSLARCGVLIHFTAPTIHSGFSGPITLEIINLGAFDFLLYPEMFICQLIIEEVKGKPVEAPNQFKNQLTPSGT